MSGKSFNIGNGNEINIMIVNVKIIIEFAKNVICMFMNIYEVNPIYPKRQLTHQQQN